MEKEALEKIKQLKQFEIVKRNTAIAELLGFKEYLPNYKTKEDYQKNYKEFPLKWFVIPGIGRYCNFELKFNIDWNWLMSAVIEFIRKYEKTHLYSNKDLFQLFFKFANLPLKQINMEYVWFCLSEYALQLLKQKDTDQNANNNGSLPRTKRI